MKFTMTESAIKRAQEVQPEIFHSLRISVQGGGCSGFQYSMSWVEGRQSPLDKRFEFGGQHKLVVYIDPISAMYLDGTELDYIIDLMSSGFTFNNPNVKTTCGCGKSFGA